MTPDELYQALALPAACVLERKVPKRMFGEHGGLSAADRRLLSRTLHDVVWRYTIKPATLPVPSWSDDERTVDELALLDARVGARGAAARAAELVHRAIPYPLVLVLHDEAGCSVSVAPKRDHQTDVQRVVVEYVVHTPWLDGEERTAAESAFVDSLALAGLDQSNLRALYDDLVRRVVGLEVAGISGAFRVAPEPPATRRERLEAYLAREREIRAMRAKVRREASFARQVELSGRIRQLEQEWQQLAATL